MTKSEAKDVSLTPISGLGPVDMIVSPTGSKDCFLSFTDAVGTDCMVVASKDDIDIAVYRKPNGSRYRGPSIVLNRELVIRMVNNFSKWLETGDLYMKGKK